MMNRDSRTLQKIEDLLYYLKAYGIRDPVTLGVVFRMCNETEILEKGTFLDDLAYITGEPLLVIGSNRNGSFTRLTYRGEEYRGLNDIFKTLQSLETYYIYIDFPGNKIPYWHLEVCEPNPYVQALAAVEHVIREVKQRYLFGEEFKKVYREAVMALIDETLAAGDSDHFYALTKEWNRIDE